jgi:hypothetical protein
MAGFVAMTRRSFYVLFLALTLKAEQSPPAYYWRSTPIVQNQGAAPTAQLLTLFCKACGTGTAAGQDIPLVAVLRDTLGDTDPSNDKLTAVWLLSYSHPSLSQKASAAVPFFYWRLSEGSDRVGAKDTSPLLDLSTPQHSSISNVGQQVLQWTTLDTFDTPLRATSRAYRTNQVDHERAHLEEANTYLLRAPVNDGPNALTKEQRDLVIARLELRKSLLGGFVAANRAATLGQDSIYQQEIVRGRNWELLRQWAEKTGLFFEPVNIGQTSGEYGVLWYPARANYEPGGTNLAAIWKLLNLRDPYSDDRLTHWTGLTEDRSLDANGSLLPQGVAGATNVTLIPLGFYSLNYRREPLLLIDFRDKQHLRRHELLQQTINELTAGVIGISHFTNWYYFLGADFYNFYQGRHGAATSHAERLDCYSQFRTALSLDHQLDGDMRQELQRRVNSLSINPLDASESSEMKAALNRYRQLDAQALGDGNRLWKRLNADRRQELAAFGETPKREVVDVTLHVLTLGGYNHKAKDDDDSWSLLSSYRRIDYNLALLDRMVHANVPPEVAYQQANIQLAIANLTDLMPIVKAPNVRAHVEDTLSRLGKLSNNDKVRADCETALAAVRKGDDPHPGSAPGVVARPAILQVPALDTWQ